MNNSTPNYQSNRGELRLIPAKEMMDQPLDPKFLIKPYITEDSLVQIFGKPAHGKSLIALDMAYCIGRGIDWHGNPVSKGYVVYIAGEGHHGLARRLTGLKKKYGNEVPENLYLSNRSIDLHSPHSVQEVLDLIEPYGDIKAIIIDTLHRNFTGDENSSSDMSVVMQHCDQLRNVSNGATIILVHHSGHSETGRARGSSSIRGALDLEYLVSKDSDGIVTMADKKHKDIAKPENISFEIEPTSLGNSTDGDPITAPVLNKVVPSNSPTCHSRKDQVVLDHLVSLLDHTCNLAPANDEFYGSGDDPITLQPKQKMVHKDELFDSCIGDIEVKSKEPGVTDGSKARASKKTSLLRSLKKLKQAGTIAINDDGYCILTTSDITSE